MPKTDTTPTEENPEWTKEMFARARPARDVLPEEVLNAFKRSRGAQRAPRKIKTSVRLDEAVVRHFQARARAEGARWQSLMNDRLLADVAEEERKKA